MARREYLRIKEKFRLMLAGMRSPSFVAASAESLGHSIDKSSGQKRQTFLAGKICVLGFPLGIQQSNHIPCDTLLFLDECWPLRP